MLNLEFSLFFCWKEESDLIFVGNTLVQSPHFLCDNQVSVFCSAKIAMSLQFSCAFSEYCAFFSAT